MLRVYGQHRWYTYKNSAALCSTRAQDQMAKPVAFVIGASGNVGSATVQVLSSKYADKVEIRAGVRNPDIADKLKSPQRERRAG